jgi:pimeloyl-ACP methyl ester carboxylesterase
VAVRRVEVEGIELACEERGCGERPLLLVHGYTGFRHDFATQWDALAAVSRVVAPDLRGHGESSKTGDPASYTLDALAEDLVRLLDALDLPPCDLLGHSMGGMLALRVALARPERVASLVLMDTSAERLDWIDADLLALASRVAREAGMAALARILRARAAGDAARSAPDRRVEEEWGEERFWAWREARVAAMDPEAYAALGAELAQCASLRPRLGEIRCPTLVMVGELDADFRAPAEALARGIAGAELAVIAEAAHQPQHEAPAAWQAALRAHLARVR